MDIDAAGVMILVACLGAIVVSLLAWVAIKPEWQGPRWPGRSRQRRAADRRGSKPLNEPPPN
jgi:hypothetical protein